MDRNKTNNTNMNLTTLQTEVNYRRRETTENFISLSEITSYLNAALRRIQAEWDWEWTKTSANVSFVNGSNVYQLSAIASDFKSPYDLVPTLTGNPYNYVFDFTNPEDFRQVSSQGVNVYSTDSGTLYVQTTFGTANLSLWYYSFNVAQTSGNSFLTSLSNGTDSPLMPERFHDILVDYAAARAYQKEGMLNDYKVAYQEYLAGLNKMKREYPATRKTPLRRMKSVRELQKTYQIPFGKSNPLNS